MRRCASGGQTNCHEPYMLILSVFCVNRRLRVDPRNGGHAAQENRGCLENPISTVGGYGSPHHLFRTCTGFFPLPKPAKSMPKAAHTGPLPNMLPKDTRHHEPA